MYMAERRDAEVKAQQRKETAASKHSEKKSAIKTTIENAVVLFSLQRKISLLKYAVFCVVQFLKPIHNNLLGGHNLVIH